MSYSFYATARNRRDTACSEGGPAHTVEHHLCSWIRFSLMEPPEPRPPCMSQGLPTQSPACWGQSGSPRHFRIQTPHVTSSLEPTSLKLAKIWCLIKGKGRRKMIKSNFLSFLNFLQSFSGFIVVNLFLVLFVSIDVLSRLVTQPHLTECYCFSTVRWVLSPYRGLSPAAQAPWNP